MDINIEYSFAIKEKNKERKLHELWQTNRYPVLKTNLNPNSIKHLKTCWTWKEIRGYKNI
jgi:hypothetical protein